MRQTMKFTLQGLARGFSYVLIFSFLLMLLFLMSCEDKIEKPGTSLVAEKLTCVGCHTDQEALQELATPEPPPSSSGGG